MGFEVLALAGGVIQGIGSMVSAQNEAASAEFEAKQFEMKAAEERAASSRDAEERRHQSALAQSKLQAAAAASGGGAGVDAPTVAILGESIAGRGEYLALSELYGGEQRARGLIDQARSRRMSAQSALTAGLFRAGSSILSGVSSYARMA